MVINNDGQFPMRAAALRATNGAVHTPRVNAPQYQRALGTGVSASSNTGFAQILDQAAQRKELKISKHAEARLQDRNIRLSGEQKDKIADALAKADHKGVREALVMIDGLAIVANTKSMTVITAVGEGDLRQNIFTNIDGAVFA